MGVYTGPLIRAMVVLGNGYRPQNRPWLRVEPYDETAVQQHSLDLRLGPVLLAYNRTCPLRLQEPERIDLREYPGGFLLCPSRCYLGSTLERVELGRCKGQLGGRSSVGRRFIKVHATAGDIDAGFGGEITLEIEAGVPESVFLGERICQLTLHELVGPVIEYTGRYQGQAGPTPSRDIPEPIPVPEGALGLTDGPGPTGDLGPGPCPIGEPGPEGVDGQSDYAADPDDGIKLGEGIE